MNSDGNAVHTGQGGREGEQHDSQEDPPAGPDTAGGTDEMPEGYEAL